MNDPPSGRPLHKVGWTVSLTSYVDERLADVRWSFMFLPLGDESFPLLQYVAPYGRTMFNRTQIAAVISELHRLIERVMRDLPPEVAESEVATIKGVLELAGIVRTVPHHMLTLVGQ